MDNQLNPEILQEQVMLGVGIFCGNLSIIAQGIPEIEKPNK